jgi:hypothetical protein
MGGPMDCASSHGRAHGSAFASISPPLAFPSPDGSERGLFRGALVSPLAALSRSNMHWTVLKSPCSGDTVLNC